MKSRRLIRIALLGSTALATATAVASTPPLPVALREIFDTSELVAVVRVTGADGTLCAGIVYRAEVMESFKGARRGDVVYFEDWGSVPVRALYVVFKDTIRRDADRCPGLGNSSLWPAATLKSVFGDDERPNLEPLQISTWPTSLWSEESVAVPSKLILPDLWDATRDETGGRWVRASDLLGTLRAWSHPPPP